MMKEAMPKVRRTKKSDEQIGLLVVGMHRSGTSAVTKTISLLGADLPRNLMPAHTEFNAAGYWESQDVVGFNDHLLMAAGSGWDDVLSIELAKLAPDILEKYQLDAKKILDRDFKGCGCFVLKDPRVGRLLRFWIPVVEAHAASPRVIIPVRHPLEVAASLQRREGFSEDKSIYLWLRHMVDAIRDSRNVPRAILLFDELMQDWRSTIDRLGTDINVVWPKKLNDVAPMVEQFLDPGLRHHTYNRARSMSESVVNHLAAELYVALCERARDIEGIVDSINDRLIPMERMFAPIQQDSYRKMGLMHKEQARLANELANSIEEFETKCHHVEQLEQLVETERGQYQHLDEEFKAKVQHNALLTEEVTGLKQHVAQVQTRLESVESEFSKLVQEFETKCHHVEQLEQLVETERGQYQHLDEEFKAKVQHNALLTEEVSRLTTENAGLTTKLENAQNQMEKALDQRNSLESALLAVTEKMRLTVQKRSQGQHR